jgi:hypothetical protein
MPKRINTTRQHIPPAETRAPADCGTAPSTPQALKAKPPVVQEESKALELRNAKLHAQVALTAAPGGGDGFDAGPGPE